ncbi:tripartite tricarboxylate transporter TctB family protein [Roseibacterium sp. SDUM158017]|uniref:tripartite tricarboxylate transporter TctB family protein n=1 Tax=Roseicyclus salinarum TaxID=3036773 RepID=UPI0024151C47|nr:tripartite tricarboxylate transporter TctB family protein [Roseibacterium sp. SDUM158017]MDG4648440.1 tripartite tricarboxylate transporter TctB family protein [Roseibacterium sp. SDUM158017]
MSATPGRTRTEGSGEIARLLSYVALLAASAGLFLEARTIPTSRFEVLGAGAFPMLVHGALIVLLIGSIAGSLRKIPASAYARFAVEVAEWARAKRLVFAVFGALGLYVATMPVIGYPVATFLFLIVLQVTLAPKTRAAFAIALALALIFSFGLNWVFAEVFNVFLPRGR